MTASARMPPAPAIGEAWRQVHGCPGRPWLADVSRVAGRLRPGSGDDLVCRTGPGRNAPDRALASCRDRRTPERSLYWLREAASPVDPRLHRLRSDEAVWELRGGLPRAQAWSRQRRRLRRADGGRRSLSRSHWAAPGCR